MYITNVSGKFVPPAISHKASEAVVDEPEMVDTIKPLSNVPSVPPCPVPPSDYMSLVREYFGKLWWLWLIVILYIITNGD